MAELIPSGVIQLPNFAELQYNLDRQKKQDELNVARDLAQYKRQSGAIPPGAMPLVQGKFDTWQNAAKKYAADQSAETFAELNSAYDDYAQAHGYGKFLYDIVNEQKSKFYTDPNKWDVKVEDFEGNVDALLNTPYNSLEEIATATTAVSDLRPAKKYDFGSAEDFTKVQVDNWKNTFRDLDIKGTGAVTPEQKRKWFDDVLSQTLTSEDARRNAALSEAVRLGRFGTGPLTEEDINTFMSNEKAFTEALQSFEDRSWNIFNPATALRYEDMYDVNQDRARAARESSKSSEEKVPAAYRNLSGIKPPGAGGLLFRIDNSPIQTSRGEEIVAFGTVNGVETVSVVKKKGPFDLSEPQPTYRTATAEDKSNMKAKIGPAYNSYISQGKSNADLNP
jgi:hypothetical protein